MNTNLKRDSLNQNERLSSNILPDLPVSKFDRSFTHKTTFDSGKLVPVMWDEILPGDSIELNISSLIRSVVPLAPVMDNAKLTLHAFFVPNRIIWDSWKAFMGESKTAWDIPNNLTIPRVDYSNLDYESILKGYNTYFGVNDLSTYLGIPVYYGDLNSSGQNKDTLPIAVSALPFRAYGRIWNDWYRDQNLQDEILIPTNDLDLVAQNLEYGQYDNMDFKESIRYGLKLAPVSKFADYFTTALPSPQRGDDTYLIDSIKKFNLKVDYPSWTETLESASTFGITDVGSDGSDILSVNELRYAISIQHFKELDARGGTRYIEIVKNHFGVDSQDLRVNRAQFLGGVSQYLQIHQVNQTTPGNASGSSQVNQGLGAAGAQSITFLQTQNTITSSFTEHGLLMVMISVRPENTYAYGLHKYWTKFTKFDFYFPTFDNIGEQPVYMSEIFYTRENEIDQVIFGYQPAWADYRYKLNTVSGYFTPKLEQSLYNWTYTTKYDVSKTDKVVLNADFIEQKKTNVAQTLTYQNMHQFIATFYFDYKHSRVMKVDSIPGINRI